MNYLAHAYLSFDNPAILTGNMISDFVKGKKQFDYPTQIQKGIQLHRLIDEYTDYHVVTAEAKSFFRPAYRLYSGPFVDIVFDHFLAQQQEEFEQYRGLLNFTRNIFTTLDSQTAFFPFPFDQMYPYMKQQNWLWNYQFREGMKNSFGGLVRRARYLKESETAFDIFNANYDQLAHCFNRFFPELKSFAFKNYKQLIGS